MAFNEICVKQIHVNQGDDFLTKLPPKTQFNSQCPWGFGNLHKVSQNAQKVITFPWENSPLKTLVKLL